MSMNQRPESKWHSVPLRRRAAGQMRKMRTTTAHAPVVTRQVDDDEFDSLIPRTPSSVIRYTDEYGNPVIQQKNRRFVIHNAPPPKRNGRQPIHRGKHWLFIFGAGMLVMVLAVILMNWIGSAWQAHQLDSQYGMPRTYQTDAVVGHGGDSQAHPTHFIFENLRGQVIIIELPAGKIDHAIIYSGPQVVSSDPDSTPVTGSFETINGQVDMLVKVGDGQPIIYTNNGSKFIPPAQGG